MLREIFISLGICTAMIAVPHNESVHSKKILALTITEYSQVLMGRDTLIITDLPKELKNRFWKSYMGTGKMHDAIHLTYSGNVTLPVKTAATDAIRQGQAMGLKDICLEKHNQYYTDLNARQQEKIRKLFPVLFQSSFDDLEMR